MTGHIRTFFAGWDRPLTQVQDFNWNSKEKGNILGAFFYSYVCTQLIGGWLGEKIGGAKLYGIGVLGAAVFNLAIPFASRCGVIFLIAVRVMEGVFEGVTIPSLHVVWSRWAPAQERTQLAALGYAGMFAGAVVTFPSCGFFAEVFGWPFVFYVTGIAALIWCLVWFGWVKDDPENDPYISESELKYIKGTAKNSKGSVIVYPWKSILTSMPVWAIICGHTCETWGFYTMLTQLPSFINDTFHLNIEFVGFLSAMPYLVMCFTLPISGIIADKMRKNNCFTTTQVRRILNTVAFLGQAVFITTAVFMNSAQMIILFLTVAFGIGACAWSSFMVNHLDIAPQYAGMLMGISNTFAAIPGFASPMLTGYVVRHKTKVEWRTVFFITSSIYLFGAAFYAIFVSGEKQSWANEKESNKTEDSGETSEAVQCEKFSNVKEPVNG